MVLIIFRVFLNNTLIKIRNGFNEKPYARRKWNLLFLSKSELFSDFQNARHWRKRLESN